MLLINSVVVVSAVIPSVVISNVALFVEGDNDVGVKLFVDVDDGVEADVFCLVVVGTEVAGVVAEIIKLQRIQQDSRWGPPSKCFPSFFPFVAPAKNLGDPRTSPVGFCKMGQSVRTPICKKFW
jgi:hypothetical protein